MTRITLAPSAEDDAAGVRSRPLCDFIQDTFLHVRFIDSIKKPFFMCSRSSIEVEHMQGYL